MSLLTHYDNAMVRGQRSIPVISRLGGGTLATVGDNVPFRVAGANAVVYQLRQPTGKVLALRAWHARDPEPDTIERYRALSRSDLLGQFRTHPHSPIVHSLAYHPDAVLIEADDPQAMTRPMVVLDWLMGPTVLAAVDRACRAKDGDYLNALAISWRTAIEVGAELGFAHGDLSGSNAIVRPKEGIAFVDYDTAYWAGAPSVPQLDPGPAWRHRDGVPADPERADDFAALLMYASLRLLAVWPDLRIEHGQPATVKDAGLVFSPRDLANPDGSALFGKARVISDAGVLALIGLLRELALAPVDQLPTFAAALEMADHIARSGPLMSPPVGPGSRQQLKAPPATRVEPIEAMRPVEPVIPPMGPDEPASYWPAHQRAWNPDTLVELAESLAAGDLPGAETIWERVSGEPGASALLPALYLLRNHGRTEVAATSRLRVEERAIARRESVRRALANALDTNDGEALADLALSGDLDEVDDLTEASTRQVVAALAVRHLERALTSNNDTLVLEAYDESIMATAGVLTAAQRNRIDLAFDRQRWLGDIREALKRKDRERIDRLHAEMPEAADERLSDREIVRIERLREQDEAVRQLVRAASRDDGAQLVAALHRVERVGAWIPESVNWADVSRTVDRHTLTDAIRRAAHQTPRDYGRLGRLLPQLRDACGGRYPDSSELDFGRLDWEVRQIAQISRLRQALARDDDREIVATALPDLYGVIPNLERGEQARIERAVAAVNRALRRSGQRTPSTAASSDTVETV